MVSICPPGKINHLTSLLVSEWYKAVICTSRSNATRTLRLRMRLGMLRMNWGIVLFQEIQAPGAQQHR